MELRHLRYFVALAEQLSFTRAASKVHVTQSTLSHQIRQLEEDLGQPLFDRIGKRVLLTEAGQTLLPRVLQALREIDSGVRALSNGGQPLQGELRIASSHTFNINLVPMCLAAFLGRHPLVRVTVEELSATKIEERVVDGSVDVGIAYRPASLQSIEFEPLYEEQLALVVRPTHRFAKRKRIRMAELHNQPLLLFTREFSTRRLLDEYFERAGAIPHVVAEMNAVAPILGLVRRMEVAAILSVQAVPRDGLLRTVAIENPTPVRVPGMLLRRQEERAAPVVSFVHMLGETALRNDLGSLDGSMGAPFERRPTSADLHPSGGFAREMDTDPLPD